jgi:hypothetical protein
MLYWLGHDMSPTPTPHIFRTFLNLTLRTNKYTAALLQASAIPPLLRAISARAQNAVEAVFILANLAHESVECSAAIASAGGVSVLLDIVRDASLDDPLMRRHAMYALYNLICNSINANAEVILEGIPEVVAMMDSADLETEMWSSYTLAHVAQSSSDDIARMDIVITALIRCLRKPVTEQHVLSAICALAMENDTHRTNLGAQGAIEPLVNILRHKGQIKDAELERDTNLLATRALWLLTSGSDTNQERAVAAGALPVLMAQLREKIDDTAQQTQEESRTETLSALCCLLGKQKNNNTFVHEGGLALFSQIIAHNRAHMYTEGEREDALDGLHAIASRSKAHLAIIAADLSLMLSVAILIRRGLPREQTTAKSLIILVACEELPLPVSIVPALVTAFSADMKDDRPVARAAVVLARIAKDYQKYCETIAAEGVIPHAVRLAKTGSEQEKYFAAKLLLTLFRDLASREQVCKEGGAGIECVLELLRFSSTLSSEIKVHVANFIESTSLRNKDSREMVQFAGAVSFLARTIEHGNAEEQAAALRALVPLSVASGKSMRNWDGAQTLIRFISNADASQNKSVRFAIRALWLLALEDRALVAELADRAKWETIAHKFESERVECQVLWFLLDGKGIPPLPFFIYYFLSKKDIREKQHKW